MSVTPSQTVGPFFQIGLIREEWKTLAAGTQDVIQVRGAVLDAAGEPVRDAMLEVWQPDTHRFGRFETDPQSGAFAFDACRPTALQQRDSSIYAPHLVIGVFARGLLKRLYTRLYLPDEPLNAQDPVLTLVSAARRSTLIAQRDGSDPRALTFNIRLAGADETVFFDC